MHARWLIGLRVAALAGAVAAVAGAVGCRWLIGNLNECSTTADCASKGLGAFCQNQLCVTDPRCVTFGDPSPGSLRVGAILAKTNSDGVGTSLAGVLSEDSVRLVVQQINQSDGASVLPLAVISCDDTFDGPTAETLAQELVSQGVVAIISDGSTDTTAASQATLPAGVLLIAAWATSIQIGSLGVSPTGGPKLVWSAAVPDSIQGKVMAGLLADGGVQNPAVIARNDLYGTGLLNSISASYMTDTGGTVASALFPPGGDPSSAVSQIESANASGIVLIGLSSESDSVLVDWPKPDPRTWYFTDASESSQTITALPNGITRLVGHSFGTGPGVDKGTQAYMDFANQFETAFGQDPSTQDFVTNTYDAAMLIVVGVAWANANGGVINGTTIATGLSHIEGPLPEGGVPTPLEPDYLPTMTAAFADHKNVDLQGASGPLDFNPATGVSPGPIAVWTFVDDGGIDILSTVNP